MQRLSLSACNLDTMRRNLVIVVLALAVCRSAAAQNAPPSSTAFHWLDAVKDAALFERIKGHIPRIGLHMYGLGSNDS